VGALFLAASLTGCAWGSTQSDALDSLDELPQPPPPSTEPAADESTTTSTTSPSEAACEAQGLKTASLRPETGTVADDSFMAELQQRGAIRVGVDENTLGFASYNPATGGIEGFEVALAHEIAKRLFRESYVPGRVDLVPVVTGEKIRFPADGVVDMTISANSMSCERWEQVAFSTEYYTAQQQFLVRDGSTIRGIDDLTERTVCVTAGSSSERIVKKYVPDADPLPVAARTDCLLALQEGAADAYFGHDSFLYGMERQDQTVEIRTGFLPDDVTVSNYGIAISHDHPEFVRFVNGVLDDLRTDGTWQELHEQLQEDLPAVPNATPPEPRYRD
jgi:polar amino acid transport system substrate-binding protein